MSISVVLKWKSQGKDQVYQSCVNLSGDFVKIFLRKLFLSNSLL